VRYAENRYTVLFATLLLSLGVAPILRPLGLHGQLLEVFLAANLVAAVLAVSGRKLRHAAIVALALALAARPGAAWLEQRQLADAVLVVWGVLALLAVAGALRFAMQGLEVAREKVCAALSAYLLAGFCFGQLYWVLERFVPGSLSEGGQLADGSIALATTLYFSFVTLASLGYGDVLPMSDPARGLAIVEVVGGQLYLAVLVARLVSAWR
jgi:hypothetical protein